MLAVGIVGGTGYTGAELLRLLATHEQVDVKLITSREFAGCRVDHIHEHLAGCYEHSFALPDKKLLEDLDLVFFATPHGVSMHMVPSLLENGVKVIDLSADYRLKDSDLWKEWYGELHASPGFLERAVYGLPEINRDKLLGAQIVACPGCYPTAVQLGFAPLLANDLIDSASLIVSAASGVSGAGKKESLAYSFSEIGDSFKAYGVNGHRHLPEIEQGLNVISGKKVKVTFVPHLLPVVRGIHATLFASLCDNTSDLQGVFKKFYQGEKFIELLPSGIYPQTRTVKGSNRVQISVERPGDGNIVVVMVVEDNLVKGASGQAIQCMNLMYGFREDQGLELQGFVP